MNSQTYKPKVGDWVEVRSREEILRTLDSNGQLGGIPFMPEMFAFCGQKLQIYKSAHKTCDTVFPVRGRRVDDAVHLDTRCDGSAHGGCQAGCLIFWKMAWLKPANGGAWESPSAEQGAGCTEADVTAHTLVPNPSDPEPIYRCQATLLPYFTRNLDWWEWDQYVDDYRSGNVGLWQMFCGAVYATYFALQRAGLGIGRPMRWFYDKFHFLWGGTPFPRKFGTIPDGQPTPTGTLNLQPGELVKIKSYDEIRATLNTSNKNRGLFFDAEEVPFCGGTYRVLRRVEKIINERTGKMRDMKTPCIILDNVICEARYSDCRYFCPRSIFSYWRELWLERVGPAPENANPEKGSLKVQQNSNSDNLVMPSPRA